MTEITNTILSNGLDLVDDLVTALEAQDFAGIPQQVNELRQWATDTRDAVDITLTPQQLGHNPEWCESCTN